LQPSKVKEYRINNGSYHLAQRIEPLSTEELIFSAYLPVREPKMKQLISFFEKHLVLAKIDPERFINTRYKETQDICKWIHKNNAWQLLVDFSSYVRRNITRGEKEVLHIYESLIIDTVNHLTPFGKIWYGMEGGKPLLMKDFFGAYDVKCWEIHELIQQRNITEQQHLHYLEQLKAYDEENQVIRAQERNVTSIIYHMMGLMDKGNEEFIFPGTEWVDLTRIDYKLPRMYKENDFYEGILNERSFLLDSGGVIIQCFNAGMFKEVRFLEEFLEDGLLVLYRVTTQDNKHMMGFFDLRNFYFYSFWEHVTTNDSTASLKVNEFRVGFRNFILELYCHLTCEFEKNLSNDEKLVHLKNPAEASTLASEQVGVYCKVFIEDEGESNGRSHHQVTQKAFHKVRPFIRKGNASEIAKANARKYGIILEPNYTFVREHTRGKNKEEQLKNRKPK